MVRLWGEIGVEELVRGHWATAEVAGGRAEGGQGARSHVSGTQLDVLLGKQPRPFNAHSVKVRGLVQRVLSEVLSRRSDGASGWTALRIKPPSLSGRRDRLVSALTGCWSISAEAFNSIALQLALTAPSLASPRPTAMRR